MNRSSQGPVLDDEPRLVVEDVVTEITTPHGVIRPVDEVSFTVEHGETLGIVGESGSGKSVLMRSIMGLLPRSGVTVTGRVSFGGVDLLGSRRQVKQLWGTEIAMVFQDPMTALNPTKRIGDHLTESLRHHRRLGRRAAEAQAVVLLDQVGIPDAGRRLRQYPHELSGGMRQRVTIAIALACEPRLLIADEPTTALDVTVQHQILDLLGDLQRGRGMTLILVTHDLGVVAGRTKRLGVMYAGKIVESAATRDVFHEHQHPYTEGLLASIPRIEQPSQTHLAAMEGRPPALLDLPSGCRFASRCGYAVERCRQAAPTLEVGASGHAVACWVPVTSPGRVA